MITRNLYFHFLLNRKPETVRGFRPFKNLSTYPTWYLITFNLKIDVLSRSIGIRHWLDAMPACVFLADYPSRPNDLPLSSNPNPVASLLRSECNKFLCSGISKLNSNLTARQPDDMLQRSYRLWELELSWLLRKRSNTACWWRKISFHHLLDCSKN